MALTTWPTYLGGRDAKVCARTPTDLTVVALARLFSSNDWYVASRSPPRYVDLPVRRRHGQLQPDPGLPVAGHAANRYRRLRIGHGTANAVNAEVSAAPKSIAPCVQAALAACLAGRGAPQPLCPVPDPETAVPVRCVAGDRKPGRAAN